MKQQKYKESVLKLTKRCFAFAFVSASLLTFGLFDISKFICLRGKV